MRQIWPFQATKRAVTLIVSSSLVLMSGAVFSDNFNYQTPEECANQMKIYAFKAHELSVKNSNNTEECVNFLQMETFFWNMSYNKGDGIFARYCNRDLKTHNCVAEIYVTCNLVTQHPNLWTTTIAPVLGKEVEYLKNNQADKDLIPSAIPFMTCSMTFPSDGGIVNWNDCKVSTMN